MRRRPDRRPTFSLNRPPLRFYGPRPLHHSAHVAHATAHAAAHAGSGLFGWLSDDRLGHEDVLCDRGGVLQRRARDHRGVDDARLDQVFDLVRVDVQALALGGSTYLVDDDRALEPCVVGELAERLLERADDDLRARALIPTFSIAFAITSPISRSRAEMAA